MEKKGLEFIYNTISKTTIGEVIIKTNRGTEIKLIRSDEEINKNSIDKNNVKSQINKDKIVKKENKSDIISPQVGFFNRFDPRTKKQFLKLRDLVKPGSIVGTIVAMHVHHNIIADKKGKVVEFLVEQDQPVAFNQPLIRLALLNE